MSDTAKIAETIDFEDFLKVDVRVSTVVACDPFPEARKPAYKLEIDFGATIGIKKSSVQVTDLYLPTDLVGRQVAVVVNFLPRQIGPFMSEVLTLDFANDDGAVALVSVAPSVTNGERLF